MSSIVYQKALDFKRRYPFTIAWRIKAHSTIIDKHLNPDEVIKYVFVGQKNDCWYDIITTNVIVMTNKRLLLGCKRLLFGYLFTSITPDLFNDLKVRSGILWGRVYIDTVREMVTISNLSKEALDEIETNITENMMREKKKYHLKTETR